MILHRPGGFPIWLSGLFNLYVIKKNVFSDLRMTLSNMTPGFHIFWKHQRSSVHTATFVYPANLKRSPNVGLLLGQRRRRWANSKSTMGQRLLFPDMKLTSQHGDHLFIHVP